MKRPPVNPLEGTATGTSSELLRQARADDQEAWARLVELYSRRMYRWTRRAGLQPADAANVVQEALQAVARKLGDFRRDRPGDTFRGWLRRIVDNKIRDHYRRVGRMTDRAVGGSESPQPIELVAESVDATWDTSLAQTGPPLAGPVAAAVSQVQSEVSPRDWRFFWRTAVDGQSSSEVAQEFGVTANTVRLVKMRVLRRLRRRLSDPPCADD